MSFEWDEAKRTTNLEKHGLDFVDGRLLFDGRKVYRYRSLRDTEDRFVSIGCLAGKFIAVIWTERDGAVRIISMRRARDEEERKYRALYR